MKTICSRSAYLLTECLVYVGLVFVLLGTAYLAMYRCVDHSLTLRRNAEDIVQAMRIGELWRSEIRQAGNSIRLQADDRQQTLLLAGTNGVVAYRFETNAVSRRLNDAAWSVVLSHVASSRMEADPRRHLAVWRWELELQPRGKGAVKPSRIRPLFTFLAAPPHAAPVP
jgi:hypothetical protein